jgi:hypothetical protein
VVAADHRQSVPIVADLHCGHIRAHLESRCFPGGRQRAHFKIYRPSTTLRPRRSSAGHPGRDALVGCRRGRSHRPIGSCSFLRRSRLIVTDDRRCSPISHCGHIRAHTENRCFCAPRWPPRRDLDMEGIGNLPRTQAAAMASDYAVRLAAPRAAPMATWWLSSPPASPSARASRRRTGLRPRASRPEGSTRTRSSRSTRHRPRRGAGNRPPGDGGDHWPECGLGDAVLDVFAASGDPPPRVRKLAYARYPPPASRTSSAMRPVSTAMPSPPPPAPSPARRHLALNVEPLAGPPEPVRQFGGVTGGLRYLPAGVEVRRPRRSWSP